MKISIVGTGIIGKVHIRYLQELGEEIVALCDTDENKARRVAEEFGLTCPIFADYSDMLRVQKTDAVHICTPHYLHADMVVTALAQNVHVLCEKPLCIHKEDIPRILEAEKASSATLGVCFQNRYNPANRFVKELLAEDPPVGAHGSVVWKRTDDYYRSAEWRGKWATEGGGVMINQAIHTLDLLLWLMGDPDTVRATVSNLTHGEVMETEDTAVCFFGGKHPFDLFATVSAETDHPVLLQIRTESGRRLTLLPHSVTEGDSVLFSEEAQPVCGKPCYGNSHKRLFADFYASIREGRPFSLHGAEGARAVRAVLSIYESKGEMISL
ncbi:MAG: Gfo/Idh/MocA family oxidoreductase [Clostridia bacterium]|nr:Gfo/Idh/MocA family oxidoreductase [Clostridia bacterium]